MSGPATVFDAILRFDTEIQRIAAERNRRAELRRQARKTCGACHFWMKSQECPRERNVNGWNRGPSSGDVPCGRFQSNAHHVAAVEVYKAALAQVQP